MGIFFKGMDIGYRKMLGMKQIFGGEKNLSPKKFFEIKKIVGPKRVLVQNMSQ